MSLPVVRFRCSMCGTKHPLAMGAISRNPQGGRRALRRRVRSHFGFGIRVGAIRVVKGGDVVDNTELTSLLGGPNKCTKSATCHTIKMCKQDMARNRAKRKEMRCMCNKHPIDPASRLSTPRIVPIMRYGRQRSTHMVNNAAEGVVISRVELAD